MLLDRNNSTTISCEYCVGIPNVLFVGVTMHIFLDLDHTLICSGLEQLDSNHVESVPIQTPNSLMIVHLRPGWSFLISKIIDCGHSVSIWSAGSIPYVRQVVGLLQSLLEKNDIYHPFRFVIALDRKLSSTNLQYAWREIKYKILLASWSSTLPVKDLGLTRVLRCNPRDCLLVDDIVTGPQIVTVPKFVGQYDESLHWIVWQIILIASNHTLQSQGYHSVPHA